jgi:hypothetical protein
MADDAGFTIHNAEFDAPARLRPITAAELLQLELPPVMSPGVV